MAKLPIKKTIKKSGGAVDVPKVKVKSKFKKTNKKNVHSNPDPKETSKAPEPEVKTTQGEEKPIKGQGRSRGKNKNKKGKKKFTPNRKKHFVSEEVVDKKLMKKFVKDGKASPKNNNKKFVETDPTKLVNVEIVKAAVEGLSKLPSKGKEGLKKLHDITDEDDRFIYLQVTLCKLPKVTSNYHLTKPITVSVNLPNSIVTDNTDVILITKDLQRGIKKDHDNSVNYFKELLYKQGANSLVNEIIPLRQLKVEYREFEAKRLLANRTDVLLCDDTVMRFMPKFLTKHFYSKKKLPVQVNLKAKDLQYELLRGLSVSKLFFSMKGNSSMMKVGIMSQTKEQIEENVLATVKKLASYVPGEWDNIQGLNLKLEKTMSIPIYIKTASLNDVKAIQARPIYPGELVSGTLSTLPGRLITVFPDGSVSATSLSDNSNRITEETEKPSETKTKKPEPLDVNTDQPGESTSAAAEPVEVISTKKEAKKSTKRKTTEKKNKKTKKQKRDSDSDSDSEEDELEEREMMYLKQLNKRSEESANQEEEEEDKDVWADSESDMGESD